MTWLGDWLRELILVVLLAAFVEMLLPSKSMERYARLVLSLLVLLTLLSPIVSMLKGDATGALSLAMNQQEQQGGVLTGAGKGAGSLEKILADGRMLAAGAQEQSLKLAAEEVAGQMRDQIAGSTGLQGARVTVKLGMGSASGSPGDEAVPVITSVTVALPAAVPAAGAGSSGGSMAAGTAAGPASEPIVITPVEPVQVSLGTGKEEAAAAAGTAAAPPETPGGSRSAAGKGADQEDVESVIKLLEQNWNLTREIIHLQSSGAGAEKL